MNGSVFFTDIIIFPVIFLTSFIIKCKMCWLKQNNSSLKTMITNKRLEINQMDNEDIKKETVVNGEEKAKKKGFFKRMTTPKRVIFVIVVVFALLLAAAGITFVVMREKGKASLHDMSKTMIDPKALEESKQVYYDGKEYKYNDNLINILLIGTDCTMTVSQRRESDTSAVGLADTLFLISIDPDKKSVDCISINRNTMANVDFYIGDFEASYEAQVTRQYLVGKGLEDSCSLTVKSVSGIFGNIPIHGYASISLDAIKPLNNVVGGVEVEVIEDIPGSGVNELGAFDYHIGEELINAKGKTLTLTDLQAFAYLRYRGAYVGDSDKRLDRQRQYFKALVKKIIDNTKKDITFPMKVRDALSDWLVTDINDDELIYLVSSLMFYRLNLDSVTHLPGTVELGEDTVEEFYPDAEAMKEIIINKFYKPVN